MKKTILVHPDQIKIRGPKVDGGYTITLELGEYERDEVAEIVKLPQEKLEVAIVGSDD